MAQAATTSTPLPTQASVLNPRRSATIVVEVANRCHRRRRLYRRQSSPSTAVVPKVAIVVVWIQLHPTSIPSVPAGSIRRDVDSGDAAWIQEEGATSAASAYASLGCGCRRSCHSPPTPSPSTTVAVVVSIRHR
uniref:Uncharacterized protein n=1 Tax=Oryza glaberrima TaxID=4538 RepID=I1R270_ORYGL